MIILRETNPSNGQVRKLSCLAKFLIGKAPQDELGDIHVVKLSGAHWGIVSIYGNKNGDAIFWCDENGENFWDEPQKFKTKSTAVKEAKKRFAESERRNARLAKSPIVAKLEATLKKAFQKQPSRGSRAIPQS